MGWEGESGDKQLVGGVESGDRQKEEWGGRGENGKVGWEGGVGIDRKSGVGGGVGIVRRSGVGEGETGELGG